MNTTNKSENPFQDFQPIDLEDQDYLSENLNSLNDDIIRSIAYKLLEKNDFDYNAAADDVKETVMNLQVPNTQTFDEAEDLAEQLIEAVHEVLSNYLDYEDTGE